MSTRYTPPPSGGGGFANPMTAPNDLIVGGVGGAAQRLATGGAGTVLKGGSAFAAIATSDVPTLPQSQTHASADTDSALTALHHTLGAGADQAAAGNHTHAASGADVAGGSGQYWGTESGSAAWQNDDRDLTLFVDGGGATITTGDKLWVRVPYAATITGWEVQASASDTLSLDLLRAPTATPATYASLVGAGTKPALSAAQDANSTPTGWTSTSLAAGDWLKLNVATAPASAQRLALVLRVRRS